MAAKLIEKLDDQREYTKSALLKCLKQARKDTSIPKDVREKIPSSYDTLLRREDQDIAVYQNIRRDPATEYRMYTGAQIKAIVAYEIERIVNQE